MNTPSIRLIDAISTLRQRELDSRDMWNDKILNLIIIIRWYNHISNTPLFSICLRYSIKVNGSSMSKSCFQKDKLSWAPQILRSLLGASGGYGQPGPQVTSVAVGSDTSRRRLQHRKMPSFDVPSPSPPVLSLLRGFILAPYSTF